MRRFAGFLRVLRSPDDLDHLVNIIQGNFQAFQYMGPFLGLFQLESGSPDYYFFPVGDIIR